MSLLADVRRIFPKDAWFWTNSSILALEVEVDAEAASSWLPGGLKLAAPKAIVYAADFPETLFGIAYRETAILLPVRRAWLEGVYCPWILVDNDAMLIQGRELLGFPKKIGKLTLALGGSALGAELEASADRGARLIHIRGKIVERDPAPAPFFGGQRILNVWGALGPSLPMLISFKTDERIHSAWKAEASLELRGTERDPLDRLKPGKVLSARLYRSDIRVRSRMPLPVGLVSPRFLFQHWALRYL